MLLLLRLPCLITLPLVILRLCGQGFCGEPEQAPNGKSTGGTRSALLRVNLHDHTDAVAQSVETDGTWHLGQSPLVWESAYYGETYLSSLEQPGWSNPGFTPPAGAIWAAAKPIAYSPAPRMSSQLQPPISPVHLIPAVSVQRVLRPGYTKYSGAAAYATPARWTFDFGQEFSGHVRLTLPPGVPPGTNITLSFGEVLSHPPLKVVTKGKEGPRVADYDGSVYLGNIFWGNQVDVFQTGQPPSHANNRGGGGGGSSNSSSSSSMNRSSSTHTQRVFVFECVWMCVWMCVCVWVRGRESQLFAFITFRLLSLSLTHTHTHTHKRTRTDID